MKNLSACFLLILGSLAGFSQESNPNISEVTFSVKGICDMCESRIEKAAMYCKGVKKAEWDVVKQEITVIFRNDKTTQELIEKAIAAIGHDTKNQQAPESAYSHLHHCCKYRALDQH